MPSGSAVTVGSAVLAQPKGPGPLGRALWARPFGRSPKGPGPLGLAERAMPFRLGPKGPALCAQRARPFGPSPKKLAQSLHLPTPLCPRPARAPHESTHTHTRMLGRLQPLGHVPHRAQALCWEGGVSLPGPYTGQGQARTARTNATYARTSETNERTN